MKTMYNIKINNGVLTYTYENAPNAKQYFNGLGMDKPAPIKVRGWPFKKMYISQGTEENGLAVAWA
jgi:hypothetical protein